MAISPAIPSSALLARRSFLRYSGAAALAGGLTLAGCKEDDSENPQPAPTITSLSPAAGPVGTQVTVTGTGFTGATRVTFGGVVAVSVAVVNDTTLTATVPAGAVSGAVQVTTPRGVATSPGQFTLAVISAPTITSFTPTFGGAGTVVTITGTGFTGAIVVAFGGGTAITFTVVDDTHITATVPASGATGPITITTPNGTATSATPYQRFTTTFTNNDTGLLNYAYALEQLEAAFYTEVIVNHSSLFTFAEQDVLKQIRDHELIHREFFKQALGASRLIDLTLDYTAGGNAAQAIDLSSRAGILNAARLFEDLGVQAYNGAGPLFASTEYLMLAGKIVSVEARHAALVRDLLAPNSFAANTQVGSVPGIATVNDALEMSKRPSAVLTAVLPYIAERAELISQLP